MSIPLGFTSALDSPRTGTSLGDHLAEHVTDSGRVNTLLDCLCSTSEPAIHSPDQSRQSLRHSDIHKFVSEFALPYATARGRLGPNDRVMVVLPTGPENALALLALASYHTCAPMNASCTATELKDDVERLRAKAIVTTRESEERLELLRLRDDLKCEIIFVEARSSGPAGLFDMSLLDASDELSFDNENPLRPSELHGLYDQSLVLHTSGTSGKKKVVPYTLRSLIVGTCAVALSWDLKPSDVNMNMMPLFHVGGIVRNLLAPMMTGGSTIMCSGFDAVAFWRLAVELKATWYYAAPTLHHAILASRPDSVVPARDLQIRMICNAAGGLLPSLAIELRDTFGGAAILPSYGMTECMPIASPLTTYKLDRPGCSGIACGPHVSIRDPFDNEREVPCGQTGAVSVRGLPTFDGYEVSSDCNAPLDKSVFSSKGWFDSGDMGYMDSDGYLYITGRSKEIINKGGEVISPFEIEEAIITAAKNRVKKTLAFAIEHDVLQECIGVVIVPVSDQPRIGLAELHDLLRESLHPSKWPFAIVYMDDIPRNAAGKPLRIKLASRLGLGRLEDSVPALHRHFEADTPSSEAALSDPIACSRVSVDVHDVKGALFNIVGVEDVAIRVRGDGSPEAFVSTRRRSGLDSTRLKKAVSLVLPGYGVPEMYAVERPFSRGDKGQIDFTAIEEIIKAENSSSMSEHALLVRDIVANLLLTDPGTITPDSDFFLLGGNSLLLGKLSYSIRKEAGANVAVSDIFTHSTIKGIASLIEAEARNSTPECLDTSNDMERFNIDEGNDSNATLGYDYELEDPMELSRGQTHPLSLIVQAIPIIFFYPLKAAFTWTVLIFVLALLAPHVNSSFWERSAALLCAIAAARFTSRIISPLGAILFKWLVIGRYRAGQYRMWSAYHLRWWIVNQALRSAGRGIFSIHPSLEILYYRMLGAHIGYNVRIDKKARLGEFDLLTLHDGCSIDTSLVRGFCVERDGYFRLDKIVVGRKAVVNTYTQISPGAVIPDGAVYGPHASSHDQPSHKSSAAYNRMLFRQPHWFLKFVFAWPIIFIVVFASYTPWFAAIWLMLDKTFLIKSHLNAMESVIYWFANSQRIMWHALSRIILAIVTPLLQLILGIVIKRSLGLNREGPASTATQWTLIKRYINSCLLSQHTLKTAFDIIGTHYEMTSAVFRAMGAKVGRRVYWPGSGFYCLDPELLEIGDDVVFGSRSELFTTDRIGTGRIVIEAGAMIADRVVLLPGTRVGKQTVMGSGAQGRRDTNYQDGSTWMGNDHGEAICFKRGSPNAELNVDTISPFGRAFYKRQADYFVYPYPFLLLINLSIAAVSATYWSISAVASAQLLRQFHIHLPRRHFFSEHWYQIGTLYGLIACSFIIVLNVQAIGALLWVIATKWLVIGRRKEGPCAWDESSYCQRWQLHLTLSRPLHRGYSNGGIIAPLAGSAYIVWFFRALGATIGRNVSIFAGGTAGLLTEPDLVELGDDVALDDCSVVAHINSRGKFALNRLKISPGCALRSGSRLLSGASMEDSSMLCEHTLLTSGETAEAGQVYVGWPARLQKGWKDEEPNRKPNEGASLMCPMCRDFPKISTVTMCGHVFCEPCIADALSRKRKCPVCMTPASPNTLMKIFPSFVL